MIEIKNLKKTYGDRTVLNIPYLKIEKGERILLIGHNGSGKSTLLKILSGVITSYEGEVNCEGITYYLPQKCVPFNKSVKKNIMYALKGDKKTKEAICTKVLESLKLSHLENKNANSLSGGECQRLCLGRVIANEGDILILDEPTSAADIKSTELIEEIIDTYCQKTGCILIMTTHDKVQAEKFKGTVIELFEGEIVNENA